MLDTNTTVYIQSIITTTVSKIITSVVIVICTILLENKYGFAKWFIRKTHTVLNSSVQIIIYVGYNSNLPFDNLKEYIRNSLRNKYKTLRVYNDSPQTLDIMVDESFHIYVQNNPNNEISIRTSKINSRMRGIKDDAHNILDALNEAKQKIEADMGSIITFKEKEFSLYLYLPYKSPFTKINPPKNIKIKDYELELTHGVGSVIKIKADFVNINTKSRHELETVIQQFV